LTKKFVVITSVQPLLSLDPVKLEKSHVGASVPLELELGKIVADGVIDCKPLAIVVASELLEAAGDGLLHDAMRKQL
jgi:hypothetical protein